ncbi:uncharacterized protein LOC134235581 [Saccostrea cucullata]|uniref:uncharacterized protein LOC134235581 n=1 Tax=Saccostrea cuccullata TaxID=36930 RepID=UPI002ED01121
MKDLGQTKSCTKPGFLVLTHVLSAVIGSGILYCALFMRKLKRTLNNKNKEERNRSNNYLFLNQKGDSTEKISRINHHDEGVYCEVTEKPRSFPFHTDTFIDHSALKGPKIARLPDIPQQLKDNDEYLTPLNKSPPYESLIWSGSAVTQATSMVEEETWSKGSKNKIDILNEVDEINNTLDPELPHQYAVLEKSSEMDLK